MVYDVWNVMEARLWEPKESLYADEAAADSWSKLSSYRRVEIWIKKG